MEPTRLVPHGLALACTAFVLAAGCQPQKHTMTPREPDRVSVCAACYDEIVKARGSGGPRGGLATNRMVARHACDECKSEMSIYSEGGVLMVKCRACAPEGVPCDRCVPRSRGGPGATSRDHSTSSIGMT